MPRRVDLGQVVKSYDVRGRVPDELGPAEVSALARAFAEQVDALVDARAALVVGRDMRTSSPVLSAAVIAGVNAAGVDVVDIGLASTDLVYYASGHLDLPAVMVTASHNPAGWNGLKLCRQGARPVGGDSGLGQVRARAEELLSGARQSPALAGPGRIAHRDLLADYGAHLRRLAPVSGRRLRVVVDAANAMAGHTVPAVLGPLAIDLVPLYFELDGTFPHHVADPLDPINLVDLQAAVRQHRADVGLAFDGDADRCFVVDERGEPVSGSAVTALIAARALAGEPGGRVVHNLICSRAVPEVVRAHGGIPVRTRVGHAVIKAEMARTGAVVGGEHSGHFYFRDFWYADSGMLAALHVLAAVAEGERPLSELLVGLLAGSAHYVASGELNDRVPDPRSVLAAVRAHYEQVAGVSIDGLDGLTVSHPSWWFNLRASHTEPLLRLNVEGLDADTMATARDDVAAVVRNAQEAGTRADRR